MKKRKELPMYQQKSQNNKKVCKILSVICFVSLARENSLKLIENDKEKAKKAVLHKGTSFTNNKIN